MDRVDPESKFKAFPRYGERLFDVVLDRQHPYGLLYLFDAYTRVLRLCWLPAMMDPPR